MALWKDLNYLKVENEYILEDVPDVYQAIYTIFKTKKGSRVFNPEFGADLSRYLYEPCDEITARNMMYDISVSLDQEPRVVLDASQSSVVPDPINSKMIIVLALKVPGVSNDTKIITFTYKLKGKS